MLPPRLTTGVGQSPSNWPFNCHNQREASARFVANKFRERGTICISGRSILLLLLFSRARSSHFYIFIRDTLEGARAALFHPTRRSEFWVLWEQKGGERDPLTRHELDSTGMWEEGMDKRNLDLGWIIERNWTPFDRFLRNQSDKLMDILRWLRSPAFRKILKNRRVLRDKWKSLFWRCWEIETRVFFFCYRFFFVEKPFRWICGPFGKLKRDISLRSFNYIFFSLPFVSFSYYKNL